MDNLCETTKISEALVKRSVLKFLRWAYPIMSVRSVQFKMNYNFNVIEVGTSRFNKNNIPKIKKTVCAIDIDILM